jgi:hypothetical protein
MMKFRLCRRRSKAITSADWRDLQVQVGVLRMAAFVHNLQISLMAAPNANKNLCTVVLAEMGTETALSVLNAFHIYPPLAQRRG